MVIYKEIKKYPRGKSYYYRINLAEKDNLDGKVAILTISEFENLQKKESDAKQKAVAILNKKVSELTTQLQDKNNEINTHENTIETLKSANNDLKKSVNEMNTLGIENIRLSDNNKSLETELSSKLEEYRRLQKQIKELEQKIAKQKDELKRTEKIKYELKKRDKAIFELETNHEKNINQLKDEITILNQKINDEKGYTWTIANLEQRLIKQENKDIKTLRNRLERQRNEIMSKNNEILNYKEDIEKKHEENKKLEKTIASNEISLIKLEQENKTLKQNYEQDNQTIENLWQQHDDKIEKMYNDFNEDLGKYVVINTLQNAAFKQILELGLCDLIRNKHKKIAKNQIKELNTKPVYELTKKE